MNWRRNNFWWSSGLFSAPLKSRAYSPRSFTWALSLKTDSDNRPQQCTGSTGPPHGPREEDWRAWWYNTETGYRCCCFSYSPEKKINRTWTKRLPKARGTICANKPHRIKKSDIMALALQTELCCERGIIKSRSKRERTREDERDRSGGDSEHTVFHCWVG